VLDGWSAGRLVGAVASRLAVQPSKTHLPGMPESSLSEFREFRERMNDIILNAGNLTINRFFALDSRAYEAGALGVKTKEMLGLVSSLVLRCDDCITYHVVRCREEGVTDEEMLEVFAVGLVVGGSIVIPHLRRALARLEELRTA
jgi:AhpD family alkylhydroperoxidase